MNPRGSMVCGSKPGLLNQFPSCCCQRIFVFFQRSCRCFEDVIINGIPVLPDQFALVSLRWAGLQPHCSGGRSPSPAQVRLAARPRAAQSRVSVREISPFIPRMVWDLSSRLQQRPLSGSGMNRRCRRPFPRSGSRTMYVHMEHPAQGLRAGYRSWSCG